jgi:single-stranded-DNA-specific exonuclease
LATQISAGKDWKLPAELDIEKSIVEAADGSEVLAKLLVRRGLRTPADIKSFLDPAYYQPTGPEELVDMPRAIARMMQAIQNKEKITIYGDYDVDGVTATAVMITTLRKLGADVDFYIPTRSEGYGLNLKAVSVLASKHRTKLIVTCDCGISNFSEINFARSLGVDTIVVDHHTMPELLPPAAAILHPKQLSEEHPLYHLPGVGVAYKFAEALLVQN